MERKIYCCSSRSRTGNNQKQNALIAEQKAKIDELNLALHDQNNKYDSMQVNLSDNLLLYKNLMWTGTGIGGLAIAGAGIGMIFSSDLLTDYKENVSGPDRYRENIVHSLGRYWLCQYAA